MKIMHVTDCMNGGVSAAIIDLVRSHPEQEHLLIWRTKSDSPEPDQQDLKDFFHSTYRLKSSLLLSIFQLRRLSNDLQPSIVHLHSSRAGFIGRIIASKHRIFYSSHGFAFQRKDLPKVFRYAFLQIERLLQSRTDTYIAFWPLDFELARKQVLFGKVLFYKSALLSEILKMNASYQIERDNLFITSARLAKAKDPAFLVESLRLLRKSWYPDFDFSDFPRFLWMGLFGKEKGNFEISAQMKDVGIELIPWRKHDDMIQDLSIAEATIITSAWESGPMTFYESLLAGTPVLMRDIQAVSMYDFAKYQTPESLRLGILKHLRDPTFREAAFQEQTLAVSTYLQAQQLTCEIYS